MALPTVVALVSGGVESLVLVQRLLRHGATVFPVYCRCGLIWEPGELFWLKRWLALIRQPHLKPLHVLEIPLHAIYGSHWSLTGRGVPSHRSRDAAVYLPGRNVVLLSAAALYATRQHASTIAVGLLAGNPFADATPTFLRSLAACLTQALSHPIRIVAPLQRWTKARLIAAEPDDPFHLTFSCIHPRGRRHCGRCNKCAERQRAFCQAKVTDSTSYVR